MTEDEAIGALRDQLLTENGFLGKLEHGDGIDENGLALVREAMDTLEAAWRGRAEIPKAAALPFVDLLWNLEQCAQASSEQNERLRQLPVEMALRIDRLFLNGAPRMTSELAIALVYGHLSGLGGIADLLHHHEAASMDSFDEVTLALNTLAEDWKGKATVPRAIVSPMLDAKGLIRGHAGVYPPQRAELERRADAIAEQVKQCLS